MNPIRRFRKPLAFVLSAIVAGIMPVTFSPTPAAAQSILIPDSVQGVSGMVTADDTDVAMLVRFVGPSTGMTTTMNSGKVAVTVTSSDITFTSGANGSEVADTSLECPVSGALGGVIDVSDAACNTLGEICDIINAPSSNFRCVILDGLRSDVWDGRGQVLAATKANNDDGLALTWDTSTAFMATAAVVPREYRSMKKYIARGTRDIKADVYNNSRTVVLKANTTSTYGSGNSFFVLYSVDVNDLSLNRTAETVTTLFNETNAATATNKIFDLNAPVGIIGRSNEKVVSRLLNSAAASLVALKASGYTQRIGSPLR